MALSPRQRRLLAHITEARRARVDDLALAFETTPQTIRKDLARLEEARHILRFHGGATVLGGVRYAPVVERRIEAAEAKQAIGAAVAARLPHGSTVFINAGTTTERAAAALNRHKNLRLITDNVEIAAMTRGYENIEVIVPGGTVRGSDGAILGAEAVDFLRQFRTDYALIGAAAMDESGDLWDFDLAEVQLCRAMMAGSQHVIAALDSSKLSRRAPVRLGPLTQVHTLVTDAGAPDWVARLCSDHDIALSIA